VGTSSQTGSLFKSRNLEKAPTTLYGREEAVLLYSFPKKNKKIWLSGVG
jgi:hypothetical protein